MPHFRYKASTSAGKVHNGVVEADTLADARRRIESRGLNPIEVQPAVLPKPRPAAPAARPRGKGGLVALLLLLLVAAAFAAWWHLGR